MPQAAGVGPGGAAHQELQSGHMCQRQQPNGCSTRPAARQPDAAGREASSSTRSCSSSTNGGMDKAAPPSSPLSSTAAATVKPRRGWAGGLVLALALLLASVTGLAASTAAALGSGGAKGAAATASVRRALSAPLQLLQELWDPSSLLWRQRSTSSTSSGNATEEGGGKEEAAVGGESHQFAIVIDCGSTGSRMFVYRFLYPGQGAKRSIECISNKKVLPGLSSLADNPSGAGEYMRPLFEHAAAVVPQPYHAETLVFVQATAGMRLLAPEQQEAIYDALYASAQASPTFPFKLLRGNVGTLSGRLEGFYAALSVNYLTGRIDAHLEPHVSHSPQAQQQRERKQQQQQEEEGVVELVGALDLGGSSTQIVFQPPPAGTAEAKGNGEPLLDESAFWVQSYLAYGVDTIRYRLWSHLTRHVAPDAAAVVENPCGFPGHEEWFKGHRLLGTGQAQECGKEIRRMLWDEEHESCSPHAPCGLDGIRHPPLTGRFLAMSVFFFALDCMKQLGPSGLPHWPSPSIDEIEQAAERFCAQEWGGLQAGRRLHAFTRDDLLPYRCVEVVYIHTLLKHGYGFPGDSRNVTFVLDIEGMEVEWTLGFALSEVPIDREEMEKGSKGVEEEIRVHGGVESEAHAALDEEAAAAAEGRRRRQHGGAEEEEMEAEALEEEGEEGAGASHPPTAMGEPPRGAAWQDASALGFNVLELQRFVAAQAEELQAAHWLRDWVTGLLLCGLASLAAVLLVVFVQSGEKERRQLLSSAPSSMCLCPSPPLSPAGKR